MTGAEFKEIREKFGLSEVDFMHSLGYGGNRNTMFHNCKRYENGERQIPLYLARYVWLLGQLAEADGHGCPVQVGYQMQTDRPLPVWPEWPGYHADEVMS